MLQSACNDCLLAGGLHTSSQYGSYDLYVITAAGGKFAEMLGSGVQQAVLMYCKVLYLVTEQNPEGIWAASI